MREQRKKKTVGRKKAELFCICALAFMLVHWIVFYVLQNLNSILLAFQKFDVSTETHVFFSATELFTNFKQFFLDLFSGDSISQYFFVGACYHLVGLVALPISLMFAFIIYKKAFGTGLFKVILFLPSVISSMVIALLFKMAALEGFRGVWMNILELPYTEFPAPLVNDKYAFITLIVYQFFFALPGNLLVNIGTMSRVPNELIEYGKLEGLTLWNEFVNLTIPLMFPVLQVYLLGMFSGFFTAMGPVYAIYGNGMSGTYTPESVKSFGYYMIVSVISDASSELGDARHMYGYTAAANLSIGLVSIPIIYATKWLLEKIDPGAEF